MIILTMRKEEKDEDTDGHYGRNARDGNEDIYLGCNGNNTGNDEDATSW